MRVLINRNRLVKNFLEMLKQESPSLKELPMGSWLMKYFSFRNIEVFMDQRGDEIGGNCGNIIAYIKGNIDGSPLCFASHMDQVCPCIDIKPVIEGDIIKTDGTTTLGADDKAGIASILEALEHIMEEDIAHKDIYLLFTVCEEKGLLGCKGLDISKLPVKDIVIVDAVGPAGVIAYKAPAMEVIEVVFKGKSAHAGIEPENGINAIKVAAEAISNMHVGRIDLYTTSNIGRIEGGGPTNIVTDEVRFTAEIRAHSMKRLEEEVSFMEQCCKKASDEYNADYTFKHHVDYPVLQLSEDSYIYRLCVKAFEYEGIKPEPKIIGGGSDANILCSKGYDCAIISVGMSQVHTLEESLNIEDMYNTTKAIARMMMDSD